MTSSKASYPTVEHVAWQVEDPTAVASWYGEHLGFTVLRKMDSGPMTHFLADASGRIVVEIYNNPTAPMPDYRSMDPLLLHLAFSTDKPEAERERLLGAGAIIVDDLKTIGNGDRLLMMRDPWGFAIQFVHRSQPMLP